MYYIMDIDTSDVELHDDGTIWVNNTEVGYLGWNENVLVDISVQKKYRNNGIATAAVRQMVKEMIEQGHCEIKTTTVVSNAMESVLQKVGFTRTVIEEPLYEPDELEVDVSLEEIPVETNVVWTLEV